MYPTIRRSMMKLAACALAVTATAAAMVAPSAHANTIQSPSIPALTDQTPVRTTPQVREDSSHLPVIWVGSSIDVPGINTRVRSLFENSGLSFYEWAPLAVTFTDPNVGLFDKMSKYIPSLDAYVKQVMAETGAPKVNIITFSQGGPITAGWLRQNNGASVVDKVVNISALVNGSPLAQAATHLLFDCLGMGTCQDLNPESAYIKSVTQPTSALPGIEYLNIDSRADTFAGPYTNNIMTGPGDYQNVLTEDLCPGQFVDHLFIGSHPVVHEAIVQFIRGQEVAPSCPAPPPAPELSAP